MAERQITVGNKTYKLPELFLVMATQNPLEQEGTYPLPEAQLDRFLMKLELDYPDAETEKHILRLNRNEARHVKTDKPIKLTEAQINTARQDALALHMAEPLETYIVQLIMATRQPERYSPDLASIIEYGASPRASLALERCARAHAWLQGKDYVGPDDVQAVFYNVLRHRIILSYQAEAEGKGVNDVLRQLLEVVPVP